MAGEGVPQKMQRWALGLLWSLKPPRLFGVPATLLMLAKHYGGLGPAPGALPDPEQVLRQPDGLAGICTDMSVARLRSAYAKGLFPLAHIGPQKWWAPAERMVCFPSDVHIAKNVRRLLRNKQFTVTFDTAFDAVVAACAEPRPGRPHLTWIRPDIVQAYQALHEAGYAHSVEVWDRAGNLAGGLYGVAIGKAFFTESMFARLPEASKVGFVVLSYYLQQWGFALNDGKRDSEHLRTLAQASKKPGRPGRWSVDGTADIAEWRPEAGPNAAAWPPL